MASFVEETGPPSSNIVGGAASATKTFVMPASVELDVQSVVATIDNSSGATPVTATITIKDQGGEVIDANAQSETIPAGGTGLATFARRLVDRSATGTAAGFIKYDFLNSGDWLNIKTTSSSGGDGMVFEAELGDVRFFVDDAATGAFRVDSPFVRFDTSGVSLRLLDSGETFFTGDLGATWSFGGFALSSDGGIDLDASSGAHNITLDITTGQSVQVNDHLGNPIFRVNEDGSLQGKTGKALTFNL